jgi:hypothetical protein
MFDPPGSNGNNVQHNPTTLPPRQQPVRTTPVKREPGGVTATAHGAHGTLSLQQSAGTTSPAGAETYERRRGRTSRW